MKKQSKQDKMFYGAATGSVKVVQHTEPVLVIDNLEAHVNKLMKR